MNIASKFIYRCIISIVIFVHVSNTENDLNDGFTFGACQPGKESCQECYLTLVKSLLGDDQNVFSLSNVFTSPIKDEPSSVVVNYHFRFDDGTDEVYTWFWACLLYTSPSPRDATLSRMPSSA